MGLDTAQAGRTVQAETQEVPDSAFDHLTSLVDTLDEPIFCLDWRGRIVHYNDPAARLFGYAPSEILGKNVNTLVARADHEPLGRAVDKSGSGAREDAKKNLAARAIRKDGTSFAAQIVLTASGLDEKAVISLLVRVPDAAQQKPAETRNATAYRRMIESLPGAVLLLNFELGIVFSNERTAALLGCDSLDQINGRKFLDFVSPSDRPRVIEDTGGASASEPVNGRYAIVRKDGSELQAEMTTTVVRDGAGSPRGLLAFVRIAPDDKLKPALMGTIGSISSIVKLKDPYVADHQERVTQLACAIAKEMGLPQETIDGIYVAGNLHDVGKLMIPGHILCKPGKLTQEEFTVVKNHIRIGLDVIQAVEFPWPVAQAIAQHHERIDGSGYPDGIEGNSMIIEARILAIADVVEAMSSHRPYRSGLGIEVALDEVTRVSADKFDPELAQCCANLFNKEKFFFS